MAHYRKIDPRMWNDEKFRSLSMEGKLAFVLLLTHPHMTALGAMRATIPGLAAELGDPKAFGEAFREVFAKGLAKHDEKASCVYLPRFLKYNKPESPNVIKAWVHCIDLIPECGLKNEVIQEVKDYAEALPEAFGKALPEAFAKAMPYQEQEQEQKEKTPFNSPLQGDKRKRVSEPKARGSRLPSDWGAKESHHHLADQLGVVLYDEAVKFRDYWLAEGKTKVDWDRTFNNWLRTAAERKNRNNNWSRR